MSLQHRSPQRDAIALVAGLGIGAAFLPWFSNHYNSVTGFETDGVIITRVREWVEALATATAGDEQISDLAAALDWVAESIQAMAGTAGDGLLTSILFGVTLMFTFVGNQSRRLRGLVMLVAIAPALLAGAAGAWTIVTFNRYVSQLELTDDNVFEYLLYVNVQVGVGLYGVVIAAAAIGFTACVIRQ